MATFHFTNALTNLPNKYEEQESWLHDNRTISDGTFRDRKKGLTADMKIITTFDGTLVPMLISITVASMHVVSNQALAMKGKYSSGPADYGAHLKDQKHDHYLTEGNAI